MKKKGKIQSNIDLNKKEDLKELKSRLLQEAYQKIKEDQMPYDQSKSTEDKFLDMKLAINLLDDPNVKISLEKTFLKLVEILGMELKHVEVIPEESLPIHKDDIDFKCFILEKKNRHGFRPKQVKLLNKLGINNLQELLDFSSRIEILTNMVYLNELQFIFTLDQHALNKYLHLKFINLKNFFCVKSENNELKEMEKDFHVELYDKIMYYDFEGKKRKTKEFILRIFKETSTDSKETFDLDHFIIHAKFDLLGLVEFEGKKIPVFTPVKICNGDKPE